jgi:hypothetical protein
VPIAADAQPFPTVDPYGCRFDPGGSPFQKFMQTTYYRGFRDDRRCAHVRKVSDAQEHELAWRWDLANHSPDGGEWG